MRSKNALYKINEKYGRNCIFLRRTGMADVWTRIKTITHLPPFMGILFGLGFMWIFTELLHRRKEQEKRDYFSVMHALKRIDTSSILFYSLNFGKLRCVHKPRFHRCIYWPIHWFHTPIRCWD
jgi:hypothetical protein